MMLKTRLILELEIPVLTGMTPEALEIYRNSCEGRVMRLIKLQRREIPITASIHDVDYPTTLHVHPLPPDPLEVHE